MKPAAIWERPALWTQTNMTLGRLDMELSSGVSVPLRYVVLRLLALTRPTARAAARWGSR